MTLQIAVTTGSKLCVCCRSQELRLEYHWLLLFFPDLNSAHGSSAFSHSHSSDYSHFSRLCDFHSSIGLHFPAGRICRIDEQIHAHQSAAGEFCRRRTGTGRVESSYHMPPKNKKLSKLIIFFLIIVHNPPPHKKSCLTSTNKNRGTRNTVSLLLCLNTSIVVTLIFSSGGADDSRPFPRCVSSRW